MDVIKLGDETCCDHHVKSSTIHVDVGSDGQQEAGNPAAGPSTPITAVWSSCLGARTWETQTEIQIPFEQWKLVSFWV